MFFRKKIKTPQCWTPCIVAILVLTNQICKITKVFIQNPHLKFTNFLLYHILFPICSIYNVYYIHSIVVGARVWIRSRLLHQFTQCPRGLKYADQSQTFPESPDNQKESQITRWEAPEGIQNRRGNYPKTFECWIH